MGWAKCNGAAKQIDLIDAFPYAEKTLKNHLRCSYWPEHKLWMKLTMCLV